MSLVEARVAMDAIHDLFVDRGTWVEISAALAREVMDATTIAMVIYLPIKVIFLGTVIS